MGILPMAWLPSRERQVIGRQGNILTEENRTLGRTAAEICEN
jgi:hypothetical protein